MTNDLRLITEHRTVLKLRLSQLSSSTRHLHDDVGWNLNLSKIRNSINPKSDIHNTWITQAHSPTPTLTFSNAPVQEQRIHSGVGISCKFKKLHGHAMAWAWKISCIALISDRHLLPPTLCIYPSLATHHGSCNHHEPAACQIGGRVNLPREQKWTC